MTTLADLAKLKDNWDGYGSPKISKDTMRIARIVLAVFDGGMPLAIVPTSGGGIQFEWHDGGREIEIEIKPNGEIQYLISGHVSPSTGSNESIRHAVRWIINEGAR